MRITHKKMEQCRKIIEMKVPITKLAISDPLYEKDVWCRYENNDFPAMEKMTVFLNTEHVDVPEYDFDYNCEEYVIRMLNQYAQSDRPDEVKLFEIGVDSARYVIEKNHSYEEISTMADGVWGCVAEYFFDGKLGGIEVHLAVPDDAMSKEEFLESVKEVFGIRENTEFMVISDEDVDIVICEDEHRMETSDSIEMN